MNKKYFLLGLLLITFFGTLFTGCKDEENGEQLPISTTNHPNIIFIIADDMGWDAFGNLDGVSSQKGNTPTLDSLARRGITFTNFWSNPICSPTRAAMLTGRYGFRTGVGGVQAPPVATLGSDEVIIQRYIKDNTNADYKTAIIGKWHVSSGTERNAPQEFGVDYYSGIFMGAVQDYYRWTKTTNGQDETVREYVTSHLVDESIDWIDSQEENPFFLWLALNAPHTPFHRPPLDLISDQSLSDNEADIDADPLPYYLAAIEAMDTEIARLIASLTEQQKENTVFVFIGDNGTPGRVSQDPYSDIGAKGTLFQGGVNTPLIIAGNGVTRLNEVDETMVQTPDMFATFAAIAGVNIGQYQDAVSLKPLFSSSAVLSREYIYTEQFDNTRTVSDGYAIRNATYKYIELIDGTEFLFNLADDPFEQNNLMDNRLSNEEQQNLDALKQAKADL